MWRENMEQKIGYSTTTYRMQLYQKHFEWLKNTKNLYNQVLEFYYKILLEKQELLELSSHALMRELEILTVGTKEQKKNNILPKFPLTDFPKLPLYFRRAAINASISMVKSYSIRLKKWNEEQLNSDNNFLKKGQPQPASVFQAAPVFYKGMYRNFEKNSIELKLFNGVKWNWVKYRFKGRKFPQDSECLSPSVKLLKKRAELHIPVVTKVKDIRKLEERLLKEETLCAVYLPSQDILAVCVLMNIKGEILDTLFIRGGAELKRKRQSLIQSYFDYSKTLPNHIKKKLSDINETYAHKVSREIVNYAVEKKATILVLPSYINSIPTKNLRFSGTSSYDWIGRNIIKKVEYKAFQVGIISGTVSAQHIVDRCAECGTEIKRYNEGHKPDKFYYGGKLFLCPNGHKGNTAFNAAVNIGRKFLIKKQKI